MQTPQHTQLPAAQLWQMPPEQLRLYARVATKLAAAVGLILRDHEHDSGIHCLSGGNYTSGQATQS